MIGTDTPQVDTQPPPPQPQTHDPAAVNGDGPARLTVVQSARLVHYLDTLRAEIETRRHSAPTLASMATGNLGFRVTNNNIRTISRQLGIQVGVERVRHDGTASTILTDALVAKVDEVLTMLKRLADDSHERELQLVRDITMLRGTVERLSGDVVAMREYMDTIERVGITPKTAARKH